MLGCHRCSWAIQTSKNYRTVEFTITHVVEFCSTVYDVVNSLQREVHCHELNHWFQTHGRSSDPDASEPSLGDRSINDSLCPVLVDKSLGYFVSSVVLTNFLAHEENILIGRHLLIKCLVQSLSVCQFGETSGTSFQKI